MAGLVVMAMIAFVFLGAHDDEFFATRRGRDAAGRATTKFGNLGAGQLQALRFNRMVFNEFLQALARHSLQANNSRPVMPLIGLHGDSGLPTMRTVVNKWLFAREAEAMGITVDDKTLNDFLDGVDQQSLSPRTSSKF